MQTTEQKHRPQMRFKPATLMLLQAYYIATPLFLIVELLWGVSLRMPVFLTMPLRCFYYGCCFACGAVCYLRPRATPAVALVESTINIFLTFLGFGTAMIKAAFLVTETTTVPELFTPKGVVNFVTVGAVWIISFYHSLALIQKRLEKKHQL